MEQSIKIGLFGIGLDTYGLSFQACLRSFRLTRISKLSELLEIGFQRIC